MNKILRSVITIIERKPEKRKIFAGRLSTRTITSTDDGIEYGNGTGLLKLDKWVKIEK